MKGFQIIGKISGWRNFKLITKTARNRDQMKTIAIHFSSLVVIIGLLFTLSALFSLPFAMSHLAPAHSISDDSPEKTQKANLLSLAGQQIVLPETALQNATATSLFWDVARGNKIPLCLSLFNAYLC